MVDIDEDGMDVFQQVRVRHSNACFFGTILGHKNKDIRTTDFMSNSVEAHCYVAQSSWLINFNRSTLKQLSSSGRFDHVGLHLLVTEQGKKQLNIYRYDDIVRVMK